MDNTKSKASSGNICPIETERKFLVEYPDTAYLESCPECCKLEIVQTYLVTEQKGDEVRVGRFVKTGFIHLPKR